MVKKRIIILLAIVVILPLTIYTAVEFTSLTENEELVEEIFNQHMNLILREVNKTAWNTSKEWTSELENILGHIDDKKVNEENFNKFFRRYNFIKAVLISDTSLKKFQFKFHPNIIDFKEINRSLQNNNEQLKRLINRRNVGYSKLEAIRSSESNDHLLLVNINNLPSKELVFVTYVVNVEHFINNVIVPTFLELARDEFIIALYDDNHEKPVFATDTVLTTHTKLNKSVWLLPGYQIGIDLKEKKLNDLVTTRFNRSLVLIGVIAFVLVGSVLYLFKNINQQMELAKMKTDFVSNVSHELRTPLALIRMFAETIELGRTENEEEVKEFSKIISNESERLTLLINRILDFSNIEAGNKKLRFKIHDLNKIITDILKLYRYHLTEKGFELIEKIHDEKLEINIDADAITEVLVNLIDNAVKYSENDKAITIRTGIGNSIVYIEIEDMGIGIPEHLQEKIFNKFFQVENSLTSGRKGSGLGLSIVKHIMDEHNGSIKLFSKTGNGSRFRLEFPKKIG